MAAFTKEQNEKLAAQAAEIMKNISEGQTTRDIIARIYVEGLDDKTMKQGYIMADAILNGVKDFEADYKMAQGDMDKFIRKFQNRVDEGKTCAERCNYWLRFSAAVTSATIAMSGEGADREKILKDIEGLEIPDGKATVEMEKMLRNHAMEAIKNSGVMFGALEMQAKAVEKMETADDAAGLLIDLGNKCIEYRAIVAMLAYTSIKRGEFENVPVEMTAAQVATLVCAEIEQARIMESVGKGKMAVDFATILLSILGGVVLARIALAALEVGVSLAALLFGSILVVPAVLLVIAGILRVLPVAAEVLVNAGNNVAKVVCVAVKAVVSGLKAVARYVKTSVFPKAVETCRKIMAMVKDVCNCVYIRSKVIVN